MRGATLRGPPPPLLGWPGLRADVVPTFAATSALTSASKRLDVIVTDPGMPTLPTLLASITDMGMDPEEK